jgi:ABC-type transporter MlaC component
MSDHFPSPVFDDAVDAASKRAAQQQAQLTKAKEQARDAFRTEFPEVTAFADQARAVFGNGVRVQWAIEDDHFVGAVPEPVREAYAALGTPLRKMRLNDPDHKDDR